MNFRKIWLALFGTDEWLGLDIGFFVALGLVILLVILMNVVFWTRKPLHPADATPKKSNSATQDDEANSPNNHKPM